jgi:hypothetical protein
VAQIKGGTVLDAKLRELARRVGRGGAVKVGFLETAKRPDGSPVALSAAVNNFGAPGRGIPPRPFFSNMVKAGQKHWGEDLADFLQLTDLDANKALALMGEQMVTELQDSIIATNSPPLSKITLMLRYMRSKGGPNFVVTGATVGEAARRVAAGEKIGPVSEKPLNDTGFMLKVLEENGYEVLPG